MENFTNQTVDLENLPQYQETVLAKPHAKYWKVIVINIVLFLLIVGIGLGLLIALNENFRPFIYWSLGLYLSTSVALFLVYGASFKRRGFALREKDIIYKSGIIAETTTVVPLNRIQHVALNEGVFSRMFGLGTLEIFTAGGNSGHMQIAGIEIEKAKAIKEALVKRVDTVINKENQA